MKMYKGKGLEKLDELLSERSRIHLNTGRGLYLRNSSAPLFYYIISIGFSYNYCKALFQVTRQMYLLTIWIEVKRW